MYDIFLKYSIHGKKNDVNLICAYVDLISDNIKTPSAFHPYWIKSKMP